MADDDTRFLLKLASAEETMPRAWRPLLVTGATIAEQVQRLTDLSAPSGFQRVMEIVHPESVGPGVGMTPGLSISINVVRPGEEVSYYRDNANRFEFCIGGSGRTTIGQWDFPLERWTGWNVPSMLPRRYRNTGRDPLVWLSYSNVPLLQKLAIHYSDGQAAPVEMPAVGATGAERDYGRETAPDIPLLGDGARLRGYEFLTDVEVVENRALHWPFADVDRHLCQRKGDGKRTIMLLYNPATERRNGTTHSFFATISSHPAGVERPVPPRGHKHSSFACNYHFRGAGSSVVDGERIHWQAGDLLLSAPSWSEHAHGSTSQGANVLTIQDHPFQIGMESLIWQERMNGPILTLGSQPGQKGYVGPRLAGD